MNSCFFSLTAALKENSHFFKCLLLMRVCDASVEAVVIGDDYVKCVAVTKSKWKSYEIYSKHASYRCCWVDGEEVWDVRNTQKKTKLRGVKDIWNINNKLEILCAINISQPSFYGCHSLLCDPCETHAQTSSLLMMMKCKSRRLKHARTSGSSFNNWS